MDTNIGLSPEELLNVFNDTYIDVWTAAHEKIAWELADLSTQIADGVQPDMAGLLRVLDTMVAALRDSVVMTVYENNNRLYEQLRAAGVALPEPAPEAEDDDAGPDEADDEPEPAPAAAQ